MTATTHAVTVTMHYFAAVRERLGRDHERMEFPESTDDRAVLALLGERHPAIAPLLPPCRLAVDHVFVRGSLFLRADAEVAVIPPVSGG